MKYSKQQIEVAISAIRDGRADDMEVPGLVEAARREMAKRERESRWVTLYGKVVRQTAKAVMFEQISSHGEPTIYGKQWWPLSQVRVVNQNSPVDQQLDSIEVARWLYESKMAEQEVINDDD